jgi:hypothetical protein
VATPTLAQARSHADRQRLIGVQAIKAVRRLFAANHPLAQIVGTVAAYQVASASASSQSVAGMAGDSNALTTAAAFAGVSSYGFPLFEPIVATIDRFVPAPLEPLPANWWTEAAAFMSSVEQLIAAEVADAGRSASQVEFVARPDWQNYVRMLTPPSCARCAILAGRIYRDIDAFQRHPGCDCVMVPVQGWQAAHDEGLVASPDQAFRAGHVRGLSKADAQAVADGADLQKVVNATRGIRTVDTLGRRVKATTEGTTRRAAWRRANPSRLVRLRPESIYTFAKDREDAIRLLRLYGYIQ